MQRVCMCLIMSAADLWNRQSLLLQLCSYTQDRYRRETYYDQLFLKNIEKMRGMKKNRLCYGILLPGKYSLKRALLVHYYAPV